MAEYVCLAIFFLIINSINAHSIHSCQCLNVNINNSENSSVNKITSDECQSINGIYIHDIQKYPKCECCVIYKKFNENCKPHDNIKVEVICVEGLKCDSKKNICRERNPIIRSLIQLSEEPNHNEDRSFFTRRRGLFQCRYNGVNCGHEITQRDCKKMNGYFVDKLIQWDKCQCCDYCLITRGLNQKCNRFDSMQIKVVCDKGLICSPFKYICIEESKPSGYKKQIDINDFDSNNELIDENEENYHSLNRVKRGTKQIQSKLSKELTINLKKDSNKNSNKGKKSDEEHSTEEHHELKFELHSEMTSESSNPETTSESHSETSTEDSDETTIKTKRKKIKRKYLLTSTTITLVTDSDDSHTTPDGSSEASSSSGDFQSISTEGSSDMSSTSRDSESASSEVSTETYSTSEDSKSTTKHDSESSPDSVLKADSRAFTSPDETELTSISNDNSNTTPPPSSVGSDGRTQNPNEISTSISGASDASESTAHSSGETSEITSPEASDATQSTAQTSDVSTTDSDSFTTSPVITDSDLTQSTAHSSEETSETTTNSETSDKTSEITTSSGVFDATEFTAHSSGKTSEITSFETSDATQSTALTSDVHTTDSVLKTDSDSFATIQHSDLTQSSVHSSGETSEITTGSGAPDGTTSADHEKGHSSTIGLDLEEKVKESIKKLEEIGKEKEDKKSTSDATQSTDNTDVPTAYSVVKADSDSFTASQVIPAYNGNTSSAPEKVKLNIKMELNKDFIDKIKKNMKKRKDHKGENHSSGENSETTTISGASDGKEGHTITIDLNKEVIDKIKNHIKKRKEGHHKREHHKKKHHKGKDHKKSNTDGAGGASHATQSTAPNTDALPTDSILKADSNSFTTISGEHSETITSSGAPDKSKKKKKKRKGEHNKDKVHKKARKSKTITMKP